MCLADTVIWRYGEYNHSAFCDIHKRIKTGCRRHGWEEAAAALMEDNGHL